MDSMGKRTAPPAKPETAAAVREGARRAEAERPARPTKREYTAAYKQRVLDEVATLLASSEHGAAGAFLRREGLHWATVRRWQKAARREGLAGLAPKKRGRKPSRDPIAVENERLRRQNERLQNELRKAEIIIDVQKKLAALLGVEVPVPPDEEEP